MEKKFFANKIRNKNFILGVAYKKWVRKLQVLI